MSCGPALCALYEATLDYRASRPGLRVGVEWERAGRTNTFLVSVDGRVVASGVSHEIGRATRRCLADFEAWRADQPSEIEHALEVSIAEARRA